MHIDGSAGEGGGQIVRSAISLSLVTGRGVQIDRIRAGRKKPGLMRQHLAAVRAAADVGAANVSGNEIGSPSLAFEPTGIRPGTYRFSVGTAGSATVVLQTVLPALLTVAEPSELTLEGGTHNPWAPPYDFLAQAFFPLIERMGPRISKGLEQHGFYPAGGGRFSVGIQPAGHLEGLELMQRGTLRTRATTAIFARLAADIAKREIDTVADKLDWPPHCFHVNQVANSAGPGNALMIEMAYEQVTEVFTGFGRQGVPAEKVAGEAVRQVRAYLATDAPVGSYLADQLLVPLAVAAWKYERSSRFRTLPLSRHAETQIRLIPQLLGVQIDVERESATRVVHVRP